MITGGAGWRAVAKQLVVTVEKLDGWISRDCDRVWSCDLSGLMPCLIITLSLCGKRMQLPGWLRENENYIKDNEKMHWVALFKKHKIHLLVCLVQWHITHYVKCLVHTSFHWAFLDMCSHCKGDSETAIALQSQDNSSPYLQTSG